MLPPFFFNNSVVKGKGDFEPWTSQLEILESDNWGTILLASPSITLWIILSHVPYYAHQTIKVLS